VLSCGIPKDTHIWLYYPITLGHEYVHVPFYIYVLFSSIIKVIARMYGWFVYRSSTVGLLAVLPQLVCLPKRLADREVRLLIDRYGNGF